MRAYDEAEANELWCLVWTGAMRSVLHPPMLGRADGHPHTDPFGELTGGTREEEHAARAFERWTNVPYRRQRRALIVEGGDRG